MKENEPWDEPSDRGPHVPSTEDLYTDALQLRPLLRRIWAYRRVIVGVVTGVTIVFVAFALTILITTPAERMGTLGFTLLFDGSSTGRYPNGTPFSTAEITSTPVLTAVFDANDLDRFGSYEDFRNALFILQANPALDALSFEYQTKLADARLTPVDRGRLEDEFQTKREALSNSSFTLTLRQTAGTGTLPPSLTEKVLADTLDLWATQAVERKGALRYNIPILSENILRRNIIVNSAPFRGIDILRLQITRIVTNIEQIKALPGATVMRSGDDRISLEEARAELEDILRFQLQPLMLRSIRQPGYSEDPRELDNYISNQLFQIKLNREEAERKVRSLQAALRAYMGQEVGAAVETAGSEGAPLGLAPGSQAIVPQFGDSALELLMDMSVMNNDADYRQRLTDQVIAEGLVVTGLQRDEASYEEVSVSRSIRAEPGQQVGVDRIHSEIEQAFVSVVRVVRDVNTIYEELSAKNLTPATLLYSLSSPFSQSTERSVTVRDLALYGLLVLVLSLIIVPVGCLGYSYFQREIVR